jgi:hypothetical protein
MLCKSIYIKRNFLHIGSKILKSSFLTFSRINEVLMLVKEVYSSTAFKSQYHKKSQNILKSMFKTMFPQEGRKFALKKL